MTDCELVSLIKSTNNVMANAVDRLNGERFRNDFHFTSTEPKELNSYHTNRRRWQSPNLSGGDEIRPFQILWREIYTRISNLQHWTGEITRGAYLFPRRSYSTCGNTALGRCDAYC